MTNTDVVIEKIKQADPLMGVTFDEVSSSTGIKRQTVRRILLDLRRLGLVEVIGKRANEKGSRSAICRWKQIQTYDPKKHGPLPPEEPGMTLQRIKVSDDPRDGQPSPYRPGYSNPCGEVALPGLSGTCVLPLPDPEDNPHVGIQLPEEKLKALPVPASETSRPFEAVINQEIVRSFALTMIGRPNNVFSNEVMTQVVERIAQLTEMSENYVRTQLLGYLKKLTEL